MTGTVEWSTLLWIVGLICGVAGGTFLIMWRVLGWVTSEFRSRDAEIERVERESKLQIAAESARAKGDEAIIAKSLSDHKLHAAENYATKAGLEIALNRVHDALDKLADRIDAWIAVNTRGPGGSV